MTIIPQADRLTQQHPAWCDPRCCVVDETALDHRSLLITLRSSVDDYELRVGLSRYDLVDAECGVQVGKVQARLDVVARVALDLATSLPTHLGTDLSSADVQMLVAALGVTVDQLREVAR